MKALPIAVLLALAVGGEKPWWDRAPVLRSRHYAIKTDLPRPEAQAYGRHLDRMYAEYAKRLASMESQTPESLDVYLFARQDEYLEVLRTRFGADATGTGGVFFTNDAGTGLAFWTEDLSTARIHHVIQHEGFHHFAFSRFGANLPMWVNEGLAEYFGSAVLVDDVLVAGQCSSRQVAELTSAIERGRTMPFREMLALDNRGWNERVRDGRSSSLYLQAWAMVHFIVEGEDGRYRKPFEDFLVRVNRGAPAEQAWEEIFGAGVEAFEERWRLWAFALRPAAFLTALERLDFLAAGLLELSRRGELPATLDELRERLRAIAFELTIERHGRSIVITAADDESFTIPMDDECRKQPFFIVEPPPRRRLGPRQAALEEAHPTPPAVRTENLRPKNLATRWQRDGAGAPRLEIDVLKP